MKWSIPEKIIEKGRSYLNAGRVLAVTPDAEQQVWHAEVLGSELYRVDLDASAKEEDYCQCPYWEEHHYCKHTVAVELYLRKQGKSRSITVVPAPKKPAFSSSVMFSNGFQRLNQENESSYQPLMIECHLDSLPTNPYRYELDVLGIALKIGERTGRSYVVKNIYKFLQVYDEEQQFLVNKQNSFRLSKKAFDEPTNCFLQRLSFLAQTQQLMGQAGIQVKGKLDKKYLLLPIEASRSWVEELVQFPFHFQTEKIKRNQLRFVKSGKPLKFSLKRQLEQFVLQVDRNFDYVYQYYGWGLIGEEIYQLTAKELDIYITMEQLLKRFEKPEIAYPKEELSVLFRQVLPFLRKIGEIEVSQEVYQYIRDEDLRVIFYLKKRQGTIDLRVDFVYGDTIYSSDAKHQVRSEDQAEILRDYKQETRVQELIASLAFLPTETGWQKPMPQGAALYAFFTKELNYLRQLGEIRMGKKLREAYLVGSQFQPSIEVNQAGSWLDVSFDISGIAQNEIDAVLQSLLQKEQFYTLENGQILALDSETFQETSQILFQLRDKLETHQGIAKIPLNQGVQLQSQLGEQVKFSAEFQKMVNDLTHPEAYDVPLPAQLQANLREYQVTGYRWLKMLSHYQFGGILADEMGLGKTVQTIAYLLSEKNEHPAMQALIVAPASLTYNWQQEIKKFAPTLRSLVISGSKEERESLIKQEADILVTSYASLRQDIVLYQAATIDYLILDEAQMVKNSSTKTAQALRSLKIPHRFALSGTPIENNLEELWALFQMVMPGFFPSKQRYRELATEKIAEMIQPFILRRDKRTVLKDLPDKIETNYYSALTDEQKTVYLAYLHQMRAEVSTMSSASFKKNRISILAGLTRLRQICCDPALFLDDYTGGSGKLEQVKDLLQTAKENHRRVILFSQFTSMLSVIEEELENLGLSTFYLRGSTPPKERIEMVDAFNAGERDVFLISLKAGGTGLNLTGADTVILYDLWWNPAVEEQAAGRAHRIGQKRVVEVWRMIAEGTIEERMDSLQNEKRELFQRVIQGNETQLQQMTEEDIRLILSIGE